MLNSSLGKFRISGISTVIPKEERSLLDDPLLYNGDQKKTSKVIKLAGFLNRRVTDPATTTLDLCERAAQILLDEQGIDKHSIDGIVFVTSTPDYVMPGNACIIHKKLGLSENCVMLDMVHGCAGYVYGLWTSGMMLQTGLKRILLLVGDTSTKFEDMFADHSAPVFGDAGTATLVEYDESIPPVFFSLGSDGKGYDAVICENMGFRNPPVPEYFNPDGTYQYKSKMDGLRVFNFALERVPGCIRDVLAKNNITQEEIDYFVFHQANKLMVNSITASIGIPKEKVPLDTLTKYGNQSSASIPAAICDQLKEQVSDSRVKLLLCSFGVGFSWAGTIVDLERIYCSGIREYES